MYENARQLSGWSRKKERKKDHQPFQSWKKMGDVGVKRSQAQVNKKEKSRTDKLLCRQSILRFRLLHPSGWIYFEWYSKWSSLTRWQLRRNGWVDTILNTEKWLNLQSQISYETFFIPDVKNKTASVFIFCKSSIYDGI